MKKFTKLMLATAAITAVSATMAVSAMAMSATYADGTVTLADVNPTGDSQTLLVLDTVDLTTVAAENIKQIDQKDDGTSFADVTVGELADGTYEVRIGGDGTVQTATFTVGISEVETDTIIAGDANLDGTINASDVGYVLRYSNALTTMIGKAGEEKTLVSDNSTVIVGDANLDGIINASDVGYVLRYSNALTTKIGRAGEELEVVKVSVE